MKCAEDFLFTVEAPPKFVLNLSWNIQQVISTTHSETPTSNSFKSPVPSGDTGQFLSSGTQGYTWPSPINIRIRVKVNTNTCTGGHTAAIYNFFDNSFPDYTTFRNNQVIYHNFNGPTLPAPAGSTVDIFYTLPAGTHLIRFDMNVFAFGGIEDLEITYSVL